MCVCVYRLGRTTSIALKPRPYYYHYDQSKFSIDSDRLVLFSSIHLRSFHSSSILFDDKSKIEKTVDLLKDKAEVEKVKPAVPIPTVPVVPTTDTTVAKTTAPSDQVVAKRKTLWQRIVHELKHYYNGFKLLFIETKIAFRLLRQVLNGHTLTRRERKQVKTNFFFEENIVHFFSGFLVYTYSCRFISSRPIFCLCYRSIYGIYFADIFKTVSQYVTKYIQRSG